MLISDSLVTHYTIGDTEYERNLNSDLRVNTGNLSEEFAVHAEKFAWYSTAYELALDNELKLKSKLERHYAQVDYIVREEARQAAVKMTEKKVENSVITHPEYAAVQGDYLDAKRNSGLLKAARDAMVHRRDMLIQLGANYRAEGVSDITLKTQQYLDNKNNNNNNNNQ